MLGRSKVSERTSLGCVLMSYSVWAGCLVVPSMDRISMSSHLFLCNSSLIDYIVAHYK